MKWKESTLCIDLNESTLNTRDDNDKLFEIVAKLSLGPENELEIPTSGEGDKKSKTSRVLAASTGGSGYRFGVCMNSDFLVLNAALDSVEHQVELSAEIDFVLWRRSILLIGLCNSEIILLNPNTFQTIESKKIIKFEEGKGIPKRFFVDAFLHPNPDPTKIDLVTIGVNGIVYTFKDISLSAGSLDYNFQHENSMTIDIDFNTVKGTVHKILPQDVQILSATSPGLNFMITGDDAGLVSFFEITCTDQRQKFFRTCNIIEELALKHSNTKIKKIQRFEGLMFVLLSNGHLEILFDNFLFPSGCLQLPSRCQIVQDFEIVLISSEIVKMWVIFSNLEENTHFVGIFAAPSFTMEFSMRIPTEELGTDFSHYTTFAFPSSVSPFEEPSSFIEITGNGSARVYQMLELSTDISLQNLLLKGKFEKAELLAKKYSKNVDIVLKAKVNAKYGELCSGKTEEEIQGAYQSIKSILFSISDPRFICSFVIESGFPKLEFVKELIGIGMERVGEGECSGTEEGRKLLITMKKMYTFEQVLPNGGIERWNEFNSENTNMFLQCLNFLEKGEFMECEIVWLRHSDEFLPSLTLSSFAPFFKKLFHCRLSTPPSISLFNTIFPPSVEKCEDGGENVGESKTNGKIGALFYLINGQIRGLEREGQWPDEAIEFVLILQECVEESYERFCEERDANESFSTRLGSRVVICEEIVERLKKNLQALKELKQLRKAHAIRISFDKYVTDSVTEVINSMLAVLFAKDEVEVYVREFLLPFAERNNLDVDEILRQHIDMVASDVPYFMASGAIPFEERVVTLVECLNSVQVRLECVLRMAKEWPVPWNSCMSGVVERTVKLNVSSDGHCASLQRMIDLIRIQVPYRCLLQKYRLAPAGFSLSYNVTHAIKRILKSGKEGCFEDCLELIKHTKHVDSDGVNTIKFLYELTETDRDLDRILDGKINEDLLAKYLSQILELFREAPTFSYESKLNWSRLTLCGQIIANRINDVETLQFFKIREILPSLWSDDLIHSPEYPFSVLQAILEENHQKSAQELISLCNKLAQISFFHLKDILVTACAFFFQCPITSSTNGKVWEFVSEIVSLPGLCSHPNIVPYAGNIVSHYLILLSPTTSTHLLEILLGFYRLLLESYGEGHERNKSVVTLAKVLRIFLEIREKEIPLEEEFISIYKDVWGSKSGGHSSRHQPEEETNSLVVQLRNLGERLLRFGDVNLVSEILRSVESELGAQAFLSPPTPAHMENGLVKKRGKVRELREELVKNAKSYEEVEKNPRVTKLVESLRLEGLTLNSYALSQRHKGRLISKLVDMGLFQLSSSVALVYNYRDGPSWSKILREYIRQGTIGELKTLLESLKRISELWVLPEFKTAWLRVSEKYPTFKHMCPIPLQ